MNVTTEDLERLPWAILCGFLFSGAVSLIGWQFRLLCSFIRTALGR